MDRANKLTENRKPTVRRKKKTGKKLLKTLNHGWDHARQAVLKSEKPKGKTQSTIKERRGEKNRAKNSIRKPAR